MATKKTTRTMTKAQAKKIWKRAKAEVDRLLKDDKSGALTGVRLKTGLREVKLALDEIEPWEGWFKP